MANLLTRLDETYTVVGIMTPRRHMRTWLAEEDPRHLWQRLSQLNLGMIPMLEGGRITGLLLEGESAARPLTHDWLVSRDTPVSVALALLASSGKPGMLVLGGQDIVGLITPSDFNRVLARAYIYHLLADVELGLGFAIYQEMASDQETMLQCLGPLPEGAAGDDDVLELYEFYVNVLQKMTFADMVKLVRKCRPLYAKLGFRSGTHVENEFKQLVHLRNDVMHPVRLLVGVDKPIAQLHSQVRQAIELVKRFDSGLALEAESRLDPG